MAWFLWIEDRERGLPDFVPIGCVFHAFALQAVNKMIQPFAPECPKPCGLSKEADDRGTYGVIGTDKHTSDNMFGQDVVTESAQSPHLGTII